MAALRELDDDVPDKRMNFSSVSMKPLTKFASKPDNASISKVAASHVEGKREMQENRQNSLSAKMNAPSSQH